jgi:hypothetical protein
MNISRYSTVYLHVPIEAVLVNSGGQQYNPTNDPVNFAFSRDATLPATPTWEPGGWDTGAPYTARVLVGPNNGGVVLGPGLWNFWVQITDAPEAPVLYCGYFLVD